jgi:hypothetical protein
MGEALWVGEDGTAVYRAIRWGEDGSPRFGYELRRDGAALGVFDTIAELGEHIGAATKERGSPDQGGPGPQR